MSLLSYLQSLYFAKQINHTINQSKFFLIKKIEKLTGSGISWRDLERNHQYSKFRF